MGQSLPLSVGIACSTSAAVATSCTDFDSVSNAAGVGLGSKACFDSIMNAATMKLLYLVVLIGCCGQGQANGNIV